jgi:hypothetical protein
VAKPIPDDLVHRLNSALVERDLEHRRNLLTEIAKVQLEARGLGIAIGPSSMDGQYPYSSAQSQHARSFR